MSNKIYICKNIINETALVMGNEAPGFTYSTAVQLATDANGLTLNNYPNLISLCRVAKSSEKDLCTSGYGVAPAKTTRLYWQEAKLKFYNNNNDSTYKSSSFYANRSKYNLHFNVEARYLYDGVYYTKTLSVVCTGTNVPSGQGSNTIPFLEQFPNILETTEVNTSKIIHVPLHSIYVDTSSTPAVSRVDGVALDTLTAVELLKITSNIHPMTLQGYELTPNTGAPLFAAGFPSSKPGRIFLTRLTVKELSGIHSLYTYQKKTNALITSFYEPISSNTIKSQDTTYDIYEYTTTNYRNPKNFINMLAHDVNSVDSTYDSYPAKVVRGNSVSSVATYDIGMLWEDLEKIAWFDCVFIRGRLSGRITEWYSLAQCMSEGIPTLAGDTTIQIEMLLPDLCNLIPYGAPDKPDFDSYSRYYTNDLYPYNPLLLTLEMGYQSDFDTSSGYKSGLYVGTKKLRRLFIGQKEIQHYIADEETAEERQAVTTVSGTTVGIPIGLSPYIYQASGTIDVGVTVTKAAIQATSVNTGNASVTFSGTKITWTMFGTTANQSVNGKITYTY